MYLFTSTFAAYWAASSEFLVHRTTSYGFGILALSIEIIVCPVILFPFWFSSLTEKLDYSNNIQT